MTRRNGRSGGWTTPPRRALVGGGLIAISALGVFSAHRGSNTPPENHFIVAMHPIPAGTLIEADDLGSMALDLPGDLPAIDAGNADLVTGRVASGDIAELELISETDLYPRDHFVRPGATMLALDMAPARAMYGVVTAGDRVSVLSTDPQGSGTNRLTADALVVSTAAASGDAIGSSGMVRVVLSISDQGEATAITDASITSELTLQVVTPGTTDRDPSVPASEVEPVLPTQETP